MTMDLPIEIRARTRALQRHCRWSRQPVSPLLYLIPIFHCVTAADIFPQPPVPTSPHMSRCSSASTIERTGIESTRLGLRLGKVGKLSRLKRPLKASISACVHLTQAVPIHNTPMERARKLTQHPPPNADQIKILLDEHQTSLYTSRIADVTQARRAAFDIRKQVIVERIRHLLFGKPVRSEFPDLRNVSGSGPPKDWI